MENEKIKFRVWDNVDYMSAPFSLKDLQLKKIQFTKDCKVMQFTGLLDRNGKEIYEGDVVRWKTENPERPYIEEEVVFNGGSFDPVSQMPGDEFEIIGNIYEQELTKANIEK